MNKLVCNCSVIRFLPYPETGEFVNLGIVACCPQVGWMGFVVEARKTKRVSDFFPELDVEMYVAGRQRLLLELKRLIGCSEWSSFRNACYLLFNAPIKQMRSVLPPLRKSARFLESRALSLTLLKISGPLPVLLPKLLLRRLNIGTNRKGNQRP